MSKEFMAIMMIFMHILDDFFLQSAFLANGKQKSWWLDNTNDPRYEDDYIPCLIMHGMSWAFCIMLPIALYYKLNVSVIFVAIWAVNAVVHSVVDDVKANVKTINLIQDQMIHMVQLIVTYILGLTIMTLW